MKSIKYFLLGNLFILTLQVYAQAPQVCDPKTQMSTDGVCNYADWNWESSDCNMWRARLSSSSGTLSDLKSPFIIPVGAKLLSIYDQQDFTKSKGWELLRRDFGCYGEVGYPYFILVNKHTGLIRVFIYINNIASENFSGIVMTVTPNNPYRSAMTSFAREDLLAPDKYLSPIYDFSETTVYVSQATGASNWAVGEFNASLDPNIKSNNFDNISIDIQVYGLINSTITANINGTAVTEDYAMYSANGSIVSSTDNSSGLTKFTAAGAKAAKFLKNTEEARKNVNKKADELAKALSTTNNNFLKTVRASANDVVKFTADKGSFANAVGSVSGAIGIVNPILGLMDNVVGGVTSSGAAPTITSYNLKLSGEISTKKIVQTITMRVPGSPHSIPGGGVVPYYDYPLGFFNIKNTPKFDVVNYNRNIIYYSGTNSFSTWPYASYRVAVPPIPVYNAAIGLEVVSIQAAIVAKMRYPWSVKDRSSITEPHKYEALSGSNYNQTLNPILAEFEAGQLIMDNYDEVNGYHVFQTPFVNIECFQGQTFNIGRRLYVQGDPESLKTLAKVGVRMKAIFKRIGDPTNTPIYYVKDYEIEEVPQTGTYNASLGFAASPPYTNVTRMPQTTIAQVTLANGTYTANSSTIYEGISTLTANSVIINSSSEIAFKASASISLLPGFQVTTGSKFKADTNYGYSINCGPAQTPEGFSPPNCCYNTSAFREAFEDESLESEITVYPNPAKDKLSIELSFQPTENTLIELYDSFGKQEAVSAIKQVTSQLYEIDLQGKHAGLYFIRVQTQQGWIIKKVVVSK